MRRLARPEVLKSAAIAALVGAILGYPRFALWSTRRYPVWYLEAVLFIGGIVLWAFVFAWHTHYTQRPVFTLRWTPGLFVAATVFGIGAALGLHAFVDPALRTQMPDDYPADLNHWLAMALFAFGFGQLFFVFAPFAWLMRLCRSRTASTALTVLFTAVVVVLKTRASASPLPFSLFAELLLIRVAGAYAALWFYLRGGVLLASWVGLLIESRHLLSLTGH